MVHPGLGVCPHVPHYLISFYTWARVRLPRAQIWDLLRVCVCVPRVSVCASCMCVCLMDARQALQQRHYIPSPQNLPLTTSQPSASPLVSLSTSFLDNKVGCLW